ncbi:MAG: bifunctional oligoribonuclease/PAP phosphatase NrnA [Candidatus Margulisiibacteriota bacterium]
MKIPPLKASLQAAKHCLVVVHRDPDLDAIGSMLAFHKLLEALGVSHTLLCQDLNPDLFAFLPFLEVIHTTAPAADFYDTIVSLDCSDKSRVYQHQTLPWADKTVINIDHHHDNTRFGALNWVEAISSVGEMMVNLYSHWDIPLSQDVATCLFAAMSFDTGRFSFSNVTADTFRAGAALVESGADPHTLSKLMYEQLSMGAFDQLKQGLDHLVIDDRLGLVYTTLSQANPTEEIKLIDWIRLLKVARVAVVFRETQIGEIKISFRSKTNFDVSAFAAKFGGGGHKKAAGLILNLPLHEAVNAVISVLKKDLATA